jgi:hypothetical protein
MARKLVIILAVLICGCSSIPFRHLDYIVFDSVDPQALRSDYSDKLPEEFELLNSAIFRYSGFQFSALGVTRIDTPDNSLSVVGFNHLGVKLFEVSLNSEGKVGCRYVLPEFKKHKDFSAFIANDIKKIYFGRVPLSSAEVKKEKYKVIFRDRLNKDAVAEYIFSGEGNFLAGKNYYDHDRKIWSVFYYEYIFKDGKIYPSGIVLKDYKYGYKLLIRLKEIR